MAETTPPKRPAVRILTALEEVTGQLANLFLLAIMLGITAAAIARYIFNSPLNSIDQLVSDYFGPAVVLLAASATLREDGHISVSFLFDRLGAKGKLVCHLATCVLSIGLFTAIGYQGAKRTIEAFTQNQAIMGVIELPTAPAYALVPIASALLALRSLALMFSGPPAGEREPARPQPEPAP